MKRLLKNKKALSPVVAAIILIAVTVAVSIAVAAWMGSLTIGFMETKEAKITDIAFSTVGSNEFMNVTVMNTGTAKVNIATIRVNGEAMAAASIIEGGSALTELPVQLDAGDSTVYDIDHDWTPGNKYSVSFYETDGTLVGSFTETA